MLKNIEQHFVLGNHAIVQELLKENPGLEEGLRYWINKINEYAGVDIYGIPDYLARENMVMEIYLGDYQTKNSKVFCCSQLAERLRVKLKIDQLDNTEDKIEIIIPEETYCVTSSFFRCMFGQSVVKLGAVKFRNKYNFTCKQVILDGIEEEVEDIDRWMQGGYK